MKIVFLQDDFPPQSFGGAGISVCELAVAMKRAGHMVSVITTVQKPEDAGTAEYDGLMVTRIWSDYPARWRGYRSLYNRPVVTEVERALREIRPDIVHVNNVHYHLSYHCLKVAHRYARAVVFTARDVMSFSYGKLETQQYLAHLDPKLTVTDHLRQAVRSRNPLRNFCIRQYLGYADKLFAISNSLREALAVNGIPGADVIYNGIDAGEWRPREGAAGRAKERYGLSGKRVLLFGGRLSSSKGGAKVIEALPQIVREVPNAVLLIAGSVDDYARSMQKYAKELGVEAHLAFAGWIDREGMKDAYAASDAVLMPSLCLDTFGRVNAEAMAAGKPVVGTCFGGTPEVVEDGVTGYIVNPLHPEEIAEKAIDLLKNPEKAEQFGEAGYARLQRRFALEDKVKEYIMAYESVMQKKQPLSA